jgi:hypothetical protein
VASPKSSLESVGLPSADSKEFTSARRFPDGEAYRVEIPSTEGPKALRAVIEEAKARKVRVHRVSQGSGMMMLSADEISEMVALGRQEHIEVNLFVGPRATFDIGAQVVAPAGRSLGLSLRGADQLAFALADIRRAVDLGIRSVLISDIGLISIVGKLRAKGDLPSDLIIKTSVMMAPCNPASARLLEDLGATTINIPSDLTIAQIATIRQAISAPIDFYIEAPDNIGGFVRTYEIPEIIRVAAPVYIKFGLRNSPDIYPSGLHLEAVSLAMSRERVRRAQIALEILNTTTTS